LLLGKANHFSGLRLRWVSKPASNLIGTGQVQKLGQNTPAPSSALLSNTTISLIVNLHKKGGLTLREWLKAIRIEKGLTQSQVAEAAGIAPHYYSYIENGARCKPDKVDNEKAIAATLGFEWTRFFEDNDTPPLPVVDELLATEAQATAQ